MDQGRLSDSGKSELERNNLEGKKARGRGKSRAGHASWRSRGLQPEPGGKKGMEEHLLEC
jgi:hypothetical protein